MTPNPKQVFVKALAQFLAGPQAVAHSMGLTMPPGSARQEAGAAWSALRTTTPLFGYPTVEEAEALLTAFLFDHPPFYDPTFGDDRACACGHPYYRHFDTYDEMEPVGCKYCPTTVDGEPCMRWRAPA